MLINPLKIEAKSENDNHKYETNKDTAISEIISYLITNYSDYLSDITINKNVVENIVREKVYKAANIIDFEGKYYRKDIGQKALKAKEEK